MSTPPPRSTDTVARIATLNLWGEFADWPKRCALLAEHWPQLDADVLLVQECRQTHALDQCADLAQALHLPHTYVQLATEVEGVAILSRHAIERLPLISLPLSEPPRHGVAVRMDIPAVGPVTIICAHVAFRPARIRRAQIGALARAANGPTVLGGDFNATPAQVYPSLPGFIDTLGDDDVTWPMIEPRVFRQAWRDLVGRTPRFPLHQRRLDYIFLRDIRHGASGVWQIGPDAAPASDHAAVWVDLIS